MTTNLPAVPAGDFAPGQANPVGDVIAGLTAVSRVDPERAAALERTVIIDVFEAIRDGHKDPSGIAAGALQILRTPFERR